MNHCMNCERPADVGCMWCTKCNALAMHLRQKREQEESVSVALAALSAPFNWPATNDQGRKLPNGWRVIEGGK